MDAENWLLPRLRTLFVYNYLRNGSMIDNHNKIPLTLFQNFIQVLAVWAFVGVAPC